MKRFELVSHLIKERLKLKRGAEIGVWRGTATRYLLRKHKKLKMLAIDPYEVYEHYDKYHNLGPFRTQKKLTNLYESTKQMLKHEFGTRIEFIREHSVKAAGMVGDNSLDFVYLDGNWGYRYVQEDIRSWLPKLRKGGIMIGHRIDSNKDGPNCVKRAVESVLKSYTVKAGRWFCYV